jgi:hypothetical protein
MPSVGNPVLVPLLAGEEFGLKYLKELVDSLQIALVRDGNKEQREFINVLRSIWRGVGCPIVDALSSLNIPRFGRVWWCPSSLFTLLPIHAAGLYDGTRSNFPDLFISSYISTASNLLRVSSTTEIHESSFSTTGRLLFVGHTGGNLHIDKELTSIQSIEVIGTTSLREEDATPVAVLAAMAKFRWIHLSCHGQVVHEKPLDSYFDLQGGGLRVQDIMSAHLEHAEFAFLSACHSAAGGTTMLDESIHLASSLQFAGFRSAVGTMWEMHDSVAPDLAKHFYTNIMKLGGRHTDAAKALHLATRQLRRANENLPPNRWAMFIHIGA